MSHAFGEFTKELCDPLLIPHLMCTEVCKALPSHPECTNTCVETVNTVHQLRDKVCAVVAEIPLAGPAYASSAAPGGVYAPTYEPGCALARSLIHIQGTFLIGVGGHSIVRAWYSSQKISEFISKIKWPALVVGIGLSSIVITWLI